MRSRAWAPLSPYPRRYLTTSSRASTASEMSSSMDHGEYSGGVEKAKGKRQKEKGKGEGKREGRHGSIVRQIASANSVVDAWPPRSRVRVWPAVSTAPSAFIRRLAA